MFNVPPHKSEYNAWIVRLGRLTGHSILSWLKNTPRSVLALCFFLSLSLSVLTSAALLLETSDGVSKILSILKNLESESDGRDLPKDMPPFDDTVSSGDQETMSSSTIISQASQIADILSPKTVESSAWVITLRNEKIIKSPFKIKLKPFDLSEKQKYILKVQGIDISSWEDNQQPPKILQNLNQSSVVWISKDPRGWTIWGDLSLLTHENKYRDIPVSNLEFLKIVLWLDEWEERENWFKENPPPTPPESLTPSNIGVGIIPSALAARASFWLFLGALLAYFSAICITFSSISWENSRSQGRYEALATLPLPSWVIPASFVLFWTCLVALITTPALLFSAISLIFLKVSFSPVSLLFLFFLFGVSSALFISFGVLVSSWYSSRSWRIFTPIALVIGNLLLVSFYIKSVTLSSPPPTDGFFSLQMSLVFVASIFLTLFFVALTGWRLSKNGNLGLRVF